MLVPPGAVVFVNNDLTDNVRDFLVRQLRISEVIDGYVFDDRMAADPDYKTKLCQLCQRIMVVRSYEELESRELADVAIFVSHGLAAILKNNFGPHGTTHTVVDLTWGKLCIYS
jgi:hypothetical protein